VTGSGGGTTSAGGGWEGAAVGGREIGAGRGRSDGAGGWRGVSGFCGAPGGEDVGMRVISTSERGVGFDSAGS